MKKLFFRTVSLILAMCLILGSTAVPAWATEGDIPSDSQEPTQETTSQETTSEETTPEGTTSEETTPEEITPEETTPETTTPAETTPPETTPPATQPTTPPEDEEEELPAEPITTADGHYIAQPDLLEEFTFPENWSKEALEFCVGNAILKGRTTGLEPKANTTRAETAAVLVRLLGGSGQSASLGQYVDVPAGAWYYPEMSAAVGIGLVKGTSATTISPNNPITREQVCVLLSRAFGIYPEDETACDQYYDSKQIGKYARAAISALTERGYLNGYWDGTVKPKAYITRAELAKLLYEMITHICDTPDTLPESGKVLYRGIEEIPAGYTLYGDLIIGCGYSGTRAVKDLDIAGLLSLSTAPNAVISVSDCTFETLSVPAKATVSCDAAVEQLFTGGENSVLNVNADEVGVYASCTLKGSYDTVCCDASGASVTCSTAVEELYNYGAGSALNISAEEAWTYASCTLTGKYDTVHLDADGVYVTLNGSAKLCHLQNTGTGLQGAGYSEAVELHQRDCKVSVKYGTLTDHMGILDYNNALSTVKTVSNWSDFVKDEPYSEYTMEGFVDKMGYSSSTNYLIWVSTKTLTVNVFTGSKGNWSLVRTAPCALGTRYTPTVKGTFKTFMKDNEWDFGSYKCRWVTYFYGGYAFHSRLWSPNYSYLVDDSMSVLVSHGCARMLDEDCYYIYANVPNNSTVVVY